MSRRLRPQGLSNLSSSIPDDLDYEKLDNKTRDNAVLAGCGTTPRISIEAIEETLTAEQDKKTHRRAVSSFSFARKLQVDTAPQPSINDHKTSIPPHLDEITSPGETLIPVDLEKGLPPVISEPPLSMPVIHSATTRPENSTKVDREIWRMLLLNMYPVTYLILWLPGIANRIAESMGYEVRWLVIAQSSTQFIGLANASVYLYKEHRRDMREWWSGLKERRAVKAAKTKTVNSDGGSGRIKYWRSISP